MRAATPSDPALEYLRDVRSLIALPLYDQGVAPNMIVRTSPDSSGFDQTLLARWQSKCARRRSRHRLGVETGAWLTLCLVTGSGPVCNGRVSDTVIGLIDIHPAQRGYVNRALDRQDRQQRVVAIGSNGGDLADGHRGGED